MQQLCYPQAFFQAVANSPRPPAGSASALALWEHFAALAHHPPASPAHESALRDLVTSSETLVANHRTLPEGLNAKVHHGPAPRTGIVGRGLFASKDTQAGEILLTEAAGAIMPADRGTGDLVRQAAAKLGGLDELHAALSSYYPDLVGDATDLVRIGSCLKSVLFNCSSFSTLKVYASAWFPVAGLINHSCRPNAEWSTIGDYIIIRALRPIKKGKHVTISYIPQQLSGRSAPAFRHHRQQVILEKCRFACECETCTEQPVSVAVSMAEMAEWETLETLENRIGEDTDNVMELCEASILGRPGNWTTWIVLGHWFQAYSRVRLDELVDSRLVRLQAVLAFYSKHREPPLQELGHMCIVAAVARLHVMWVLAQRLPKEMVPHLRAGYMFGPAVEELFDLAAAQGPTDLMALLLMY